jgi:hypothetical protein
VKNSEKSKNHVVTNPIYEKPNQEDDDIQLEPLIKRDSVDNVMQLTEKFDSFAYVEEAIRDIDMDSAESGSHKTLTEVDSSNTIEQKSNTVIEMDDTNDSTLKHAGINESPIPSSLIKFNGNQGQQRPVYLKSSLESTPTISQNGQQMDNRSVSSSIVTQDSMNTSRKYNRTSLIEDRIHRKSLVDDVSKKEKKRLSSVSNTIPLDFNFVENSIDYALETQLNDDKFCDEPESNHISTSDIYRKYIEEKRTTQKTDPKQSSTSLYSTRTEESEKSCY